MLGGNKRHRFRCILAAAAAWLVLGLPLSASAGVSWQTVADGPNATAVFEAAVNWDAATYDPAPPTPPGPELAPPGIDSTWFIEGAGDDEETPEDDSRPGFHGTIFMTEPRDGRDALHPKIGGGAIGGGHSDEVTTLVISTDVTFTGLERTETGVVDTDTREVRVGNQDWTDDDVFPWGIVKQTTGTVHLEYATNLVDSDIKLASDKTLAAGAVWEVGGDASLILHSDVHMSFKGSVKAPGAIFRVRGSDVGPIEVGVGNVAPATARFMVHSQAASWDVTQVNLGAGERDQLNRGKSIVEFVLDDGGVSPIAVGDILSIGSQAFITPPGQATRAANMLGFLRIKLSQPTAAGSGVYNPGDPGAGDVIVLFEADQIGSLIPTSTGETGEGRFFDPDHADAGIRPHSFLFDGGTVRADYAGAQYTWQINYFESSTGRDGIIDPAVILSGLNIIGLPGDLNGDTLLDAADRTALLAAIASPPTLGVGGPQHLFDLNADDLVNNLDLSTFNTYFLAGGMPGDYNADGKVDAADYTVWRDNLGAPTNDSLHGNGDEVVGVGPGDYNLWKMNFGMGLGAGAGGTGGVAAPEPSTLLTCLLSGLGLFGFRRRVA